MKSLVVDKQYILREPGKKGTKSEEPPTLKIVCVAVKLTVLIDD